MKDFQTPNRNNVEDADFTYFTGIEVTEKLTTMSFSGITRGNEIAMKAIYDYIEQPGVVDIRMKFNGFRYKLYHS